MNEYDKIANLVISLTEIDIFENRRTQSHVDARAFFDFIMRKLKNKTYTGIAKYYHTKGKSADHSTILYRTNMFDEIKCRKPEYKTWLNIIKNEIMKYIFVFIGGFMHYYGVSSRILIMYSIFIIIISVRDISWKQNISQ